MTADAAPGVDPIDPARTPDGVAPPTMLQVNLVAFRTILRREIVRFMRIWLQTLLPSTVTMTLYFIVFGQLIGERIGTMDGIPYPAFVAPGLIMMAVITNSYSNVVSSFFSAKFQRFVEEMMISPTSGTVILLGYVAGGVARGILVGCMVTVVALFFTRLEVHSVLVTASVVVLTSVLFATGGFINAIFARKFDDISIVPTFVLTPLTYLGGVFYSVDLLPPFWKTVSLVNPILYMINAFRFGILGKSDIDIGVALSVIVVFVVGLLGVASYMIHRGVGLRS